ncbi:DUF4351 domain-containing protein [Leptolyngbya sp. AN03gr2]|uniref:DUF4351 domain-containing protein n=1 Tax=unclassified Leptolyngbya TaxID=2650499 RepID=UPI003D31F26F
MSRTPFDSFSKQFLEELLSPLGEVRINQEVAGESRFIDIRFMPTARSSTEFAALGLLGRMSRTQCLIEPFRNPPTRTEAKSCLTKLFLVQADLQRQARREERQISDKALPRLWILAPSASPAFLGKFPAYPRRDWLPGVYFLGDIFDSAIIAINELPVVPETLWIRLLGRGQTQRQAIIETLALPSVDRQRDIVLELLSNWKISLEISPEFQQQEEPELMAQLSQAYLDWKQETQRRAMREGIQEGIQQGIQEGIQQGIQEGIQQGIQEGIQQGIQEGIQQGIQRERQSLVIQLLDRKLGTLSASTRDRITPLSSDQLEALAIALLDFHTVENLETWLNNAIEQS